MGKFIKKISKRTALPPESLIYIGEKKTEKTKITLVDYDTKQYQEKELKTIEETDLFMDKPTITWINVEGIHRVNVVKRVGDYFKLHPLLLEDVLNTEQRPKLEDFGEYSFIVLKMLDYNENKNEVITEQVSLVLSDKFVLSFQEKEIGVVNMVKERIKNPKSRLRDSGTDYLVYALLDAIVDNYFLVLEKLGERIELMEEELVTKPGSSTLHAIHGLKRDMIFLRRSVWPLREVISFLERGESPLVKDTTLRYLADVYDHTIQVIDTTETFRDMVSGMLDIYLSSISNKMNEVMKVLTIIATIFIPLTFITGLYGMNFVDMPELKWRWGYFMILGVMVFLGVAMTAYFKRKRWF
ncbi:MAG: magnesium/cobalt transporter CorA [Candidatus Omnitrophota bacterium]